MKDAEQFTLEEAHTKFAKRTNGETWDLLGKGDRSDEENQRMIMVAHTSLYHWLQVGTAVHQQRGEWMLAKVYTVLGMADIAILHARRCLALTENYQDQMEDFDRAFAYEGIARASALSGNQQEAKKYLEMAQAAGEAILDAEDKEIFMGDLNSGEWYGVS